MNGKRPEWLAVIFLGLCALLELYSLFKMRFGILTLVGLAVIVGFLYSAWIIAKHTMSWEDDGEEPIIESIQENT